MIRLSFIHHQTRISFIVNQVKYMVISNMSEYWCIHQCVYQTLNRLGISEYAEENGKITRIEIDEESISKFDEIIFVHHHFNVEEDLKMGTKSLLLRYLNSLLMEKLMHEEILQLASMFRLVTNLLSEEEVVFQPIDLNAKILSKLFNGYFMIDDLCCNGVDFNYEKIICIQLKLIQKIVNQEKRFIIIIELIFYTDEIIKTIETMKSCIVLVICMTKEIVNKKNNIYWNHLDFEDEEQLYERMMSMTDYLNLEDYKKMLKKEHLNKNCN